MTEPDKRKERRSNVGPQEVGLYTPGLARIEQFVTDKYRTHDLEWSQQDEKRWMNLYSHLNHSSRVKMVCEAIATELGWSHDDIKLVGMAGYLHDYSKVNEACAEYRERRTFSEEERIAFREKHQRLSQEDIIRELVPLVRVSDRLFLTFVSIIARYHHSPELIRVMDLRTKCICVNLSDRFVSHQETREDPGKGLGQFAAVDAVMVHVSNVSNDMRYAALIPDMEMIGGALKRCFGPTEGMNPDA